MRKINFLTINDFIIPKINIHELEIIYRECEILIYNINNKSNIDFLKNKEFSVNMKIVIFYMVRLLRIYNENKNPIEKSNFIREILGIKEIITIALLKKEYVFSQNSRRLENTNEQGCIDSLSKAIITVYQNSVNRVPVQEEIDIWKNNFANGEEFHEFMLGMSLCPEAKNIPHNNSSLFDNKSDNDFIMSVYECIQNRGAKAREIYGWESQLSNNQVTRSDILSTVFSETVSYYESSASKIIHDGLSCNVMGTSKFVTHNDWMLKADEINQNKLDCKDDNRYKHHFNIKTKKSFLVTAIASLYRGGDFIDQFMENITTQMGFNDFCELIIVDADSPENEYKTISRYLKNNDRIKYLRMNHCIGIYDAWNVGVKSARGEFLTNTNLDDLRRIDSLSIQASTLDNLPFVDIVYQDFFYTFDPNLTFEEITHFNYESNLPIVTKHNMMEYNSPHNAPMWRKSLHDELGYFNTNFQSAGDYEFWLRCLSANKCFFKINDPHIVYYQNPNGLSTRPDSKGIVEANEIHKTYGRSLAGKNILMNFEDFMNTNIGKFSLEERKDLDRYRQTQSALRNLSKLDKF